MSLSGSGYAPIWGPVLLVLGIFFVIAVVQWNKMKLKYHKLKSQMSRKASDGNNKELQSIRRELNNSITSSATSPLLDKQTKPSPIVVIESIEVGNEVVEEVDIKYNPPTPHATKSPSDDLMSSTYLSKPPLSPSEGFGKRKDSSVPRQWQRGRLLGSGSFGSVHVGIRGNGTLFAVKTMSLHSELPKERLIELRREVELMSDLRHPNIVRYYGASIDDEGLNIFMECIHGGTLGEFVRKLKRALDETTAIAYVRQILFGVGYLHKHEILHRDLKADNILMGSEGQLKLADFGTSKKLDIGDSRKSFLSGTPLWMAPEAITSPSGVTLKADIWSVGCVTCELLNQGKPAWPTEGFDTTWQAMYTVGNWKEPLPPCAPKSPAVSEEAVDFLKICLSPDSEKRWSADNLLNHHWLYNFIDQDDTSSNSDLGGTRRISEKLQEMIKASFTTTAIGKQRTEVKPHVDEPDWLNTVSSVDSMSEQETVESKPVVNPVQQSPAVMELSPAVLHEPRTSSESSSHLSSPQVPSPLINNNQHLLKVGFSQNSGCPNISNHSSGIPIPSMKPTTYYEEEAVAL